MRVVTGIPKDKCKSFTRSLTNELSTDHCCSAVDKIIKLNQKLKGWSQFYCFTDYSAKIYDKIDRAVFWRLVHWLGSKFKASIKSLMKTFIRLPSPEMAKTWTYFGKTNNDVVTGASLCRLVSSTKVRFRWRLPESNPYGRVEARHTVTSKYINVAMTVGRN